MKDISTLDKHIERIQSRVIKEIIEIQKKTADDICRDAKRFAPGNEYKDSIKVNGLEIKNNVISTSITTNATVQAKFNGNIYNLGYLLENGTLEHAIPNAFGLGFTYGYIDRYGYRHKGTMDKDWHPGFAPIPHFIPALLFNRNEYDNKIKKVLDKEFK